MQMGSEVVAATTSPARPSLPSIRSRLILHLILLLCFVLVANIYFLQQYAHRPSNSEFRHILDKSKLSTSAVRSIDDNAHHIKNELNDINSSLNELETNVRTLAQQLPIPKDFRNHIFNRLDYTNARIQDMLDTPTFEELRQHNQNLTGHNILLFYADDWSHHTLSSYHKIKPLNSILKTPNLDKLASEGIRFTHNCVTTSICWISRATLYTGQYLSRHNTSKLCCWNGMKKPARKIDTPGNWKELSPYEILAANGYHVGHVGKWGMYLPFDKSVHYNVEEDGWHYKKIGDKMWHITEKNEADALRFLAERPPDRPFFLNVAFFATHAVDSDKTQYMPQKESMNMYADDEIPIPPTGTESAWEKMPYFFNEKNYGRIRWHWRFENYTQHQVMMKNYYRMATEVDSAIGMIIDELKRQNAYENTIIIFTTDNGNFHSEHGLADKWYPHEESIRVPLIIRDPRALEEKIGTSNDDFTLNIDLAPTILGAAGIEPPDKYMGRDISQLYLKPFKKVQWRTEFFYEHPKIGYNQAVPASEALVRRDYKYMFWPDWDFEQMFDLVNDPGELNDISNSTDPKIKEVLKEMKSRFVDLKKLVKSDEMVTL